MGFILCVRARACVLFCVCYFVYIANIHTYNVFKNTGKYSYEILVINNNYYVDLHKITLFGFPEVS